MPPSSTTSGEGAPLGLVAFPVAREGEAVGVIGAVGLAGCRWAVVMKATASIPTYAERFDLGAIAAACGLDVPRADDPTSLAGAVERSTAGPGPCVLHAKIEPGNESRVPLLSDPAVLADRFRSWLTTSGGR